jgi:hypothetical protein
MATPARSCEHCGAELQPNTFFCGACGKAVAPSGKPAAAKQTMLGGPQLVTPPGPPQAGPADQPPAPAAPAHAPGAMGRTMLGIPQTARPSPAGTPASEPEPARAPAAKAGARTMVGMPNLAAPAATSSGGDAGAQPARAAGQGREQTLVGMPEASGFSDTDPLRPPGSAPAARDSRTLMGLEDGAAAVEDAVVVGDGRASSPSRTSQPRASRPSGRGSGYQTLPGVRRRSALLLALAGAALAAAALLAYLALRGDHGPDLRVRVVSSGAGETMVFEVPGAAAGAKLRFGGQEKPIEAGRVSFPLAPDSLRVGKNVVLYDLVQPGGEVQLGKVSLAVDYRVTLDTAPLRAGKAAVDVVVSALPGSQVWLDGQPLTLDPQGRGVRSDPLQLGASAGRVEHVVNYRVQPPSGETSVGELRTSIPVTTMEIDKPGADVITDRDAVEIAGAVDKRATVTVDGKPVTVEQGRFLHHYPLPKAGHYQPAIVATSEGKAPHAITLKIERVADLAAAAKGFSADPQLTYAKIAQNPAIYRGQRVALEGRVYNVSVESGRSVLQMLVRECPSSQRCPLWVSYHAATDFTVDSWVRVLGTVQGEQQFRSETDEVKVVPKVEAAFLLPAKP